MIATDYRSSPFVAYPFEEHPFRGSGNDYECSQCHRPRAMHRHDGFLPNTAKENLTPFYRRHPRWTPNIRNEKETTLSQLT